nr:MAG TPA: hypothetical protein [Caudoviricetes sp.]
MQNFCESLTRVLWMFWECFAIVSVLFVYPSIYI